MTLQCMNISVGYYYYYYLLCRFVVRLLFIYLLLDLVAIVGFFELETIPGHIFHTVP